MLVKEKRVYLTTSQGKVRENQGKPGKYYSHFCFESCTKYCFLVALFISSILSVRNALFQVPKDMDLPEAAAKAKQKEEQRRVDEAEPLNEEEIKEKEELLTEVYLNLWSFLFVESFHRFHINIVFFLYFVVFLHLLSRMFSGIHKLV